MNKTKNQNKTKLFRARIEVLPREGLFEPEGALIARTLRQLDLADPDTVIAGKLFVLQFAAADLESARRQAEEIAERVLANPQIERWSCQIEPLSEEQDELSATVIIPEKRAG